jgi:hypothetical protein
MTVAIELNLFHFSSRQQQPTKLLVFALLDLAWTQKVVGDGVHQKE